MLAGIAGNHTGLTIGDLAECPAPLARDPDRVAALFGKVAAIEDQHAALSIAKRVSDQLAMGLEHTSIVPGAQADELLQGLDIAVGMRQGDRLNRLALQIGELAVQIGQGPVALFRAHKQRGEVGVIGEQVVGQRLHIARCQIDDGRLA